MSSIESSSSFQDTVREFEHIMQLVKTGPEIPPIQIHETVEILSSVKSDLFSIIIDDKTIKYSTSAEHDGNNMTHSSIGCTV